jgi:hypothetical protein
MSFVCYLLDRVAIERKLGLTTGAQRTALRAAADAERSTTCGECQWQR